MKKLFFIVKMYSLKNIKTVESGNIRNLVGHSNFLNK